MNDHVNCNRLNDSSYGWLKAFLLGVFILCFLSSWSQEAEKVEMPFRYLNSDDGLSQVSINDLLYDSEGYLWVATQDGLNRYNGQKFTVFKNKRNDPTTIAGNLTNTLMEDDKGRIWVGCINHGVSIFNRCSSTFKSVEFKGVLSEQIIVSDLEMGAAGRVYISTRTHGLFRVNENELQAFLAKQILPNNKDLQTAHSLCLIEDDLLLVGLEGRIAKINFSENGENMEILENFDCQGVVNTIQRQNDSILWIGTEMGCWKYNITTQESIKLNLYYEKRNSGGNVQINDFGFFDQQVWVCSGDGLYKLDYSKNDQGPQMSVAVNHHSVPTSLSHNSCLSICSANKLLFVGTSQFINVHNPENHFSVMNSNGVLGESINNNIIFSIYEDEENQDLWVGTSGGGLNLRRQGKYFHFTKNSESHAIVDDIVREIEEVGADWIWLATTNGLSILNRKEFDPHEPKFISHISNLSTNDLASNNLRSILYADEQIWIVSYGGGMSRFTGDIDKNKFTFQNFRHEVSDNNSISSDKIHCIRPSREPYVYWLGTERGLCSVRFPQGNFNRPIFKTYQHVDADSNSIASNSVHDITLDDDGILWLATRVGLSRFDPNTERATSYYKEDGLIDPVLYFVQHDDNGMVWMGTNNGLSRFNPQTKTFLNFTHDEGLQDKEFNIKARFKNNRGILYLGGVGGISRIDPNRINDSADSIFVKLESVTAYENTGQNSVPLSIIGDNRTSNISVNFDNFPIHLTFSASDVNPWRRITYEINTDPDQNRWLPLGEENSVTFHKLPHRKQELKIRAIEKGAPWGNHTHSVFIDVRPPIWNTWTAYFIYLLIPLLVIWYLYRMKLKSRLAHEESKRLVEIDQLKSKLHTNITHEFRTPLTVIKGLSEEIGEKIDFTSKPEVKGMFGVIDRNCNQLLDLINQILDLRKIDAGQHVLDLKQGDIVPYIKYIVEEFTSLAEHQEKQLVFYTEEQELILDYDEKVIKQIVSNLLSNAIKFTNKEEQVFCHLKKEKEQLTLKVRDTGKGISESELPKIFDRFYQVESNESNHVSGNGIGLALVKDLVEMMNGTISVESVIGKGTTFVVSCPITRTAKVAHQIDSVEPQVLVQDEINEGGYIDDSKPFILIVEDNHDVAEYIAYVLKDQYFLKHANDGLEGLELARKHLPDLIVSDVMMPEMGGLEMCGILKDEIATCHIPVIFLTAKADETSLIEGISEGADAYLTKPFNKKELLIRVEKILESRRKLIEIYSSGVLHKPKTNTEKLNNKFLKQVSQVIIDYLGEPQLTPAFLAQQMALSSSQVYRKLKATTGKSTALFIRQVRLKEAKKLLENGDLNISEIAYDVGFNDPNWFSRAFKQEFGLPPSEFKK